jgi:hypothetical protein
MVRLPARRTNFKPKSIGALERVTANGGQRGGSFARRLRARVDMTG